MEAVHYLKKQIKSMRSLQASVLESVTDEQIRTVLPGTTSPIGVIWLHMANGEDNFLSTITGKPSLWVSAGWRERFGLEKAPRIGEDWSGYKDVKLNKELLQDYTTAVAAATKAYLEAITDENLDETVKFFTDSDPKANVWVLLIGHTLIHSGEIAALKGVQGERGLPF